MNRISAAIAFLGIAVICPIQLGRCENAAVAWPAKSPEGAAVQFFTWYMKALNKNSYPLESDRNGLRQYVTERLIREIDQMPKGPEGLNGDYFVDAQEWDPAWEKNIEVLKTVTNGETTVINLMLTGPQNTNHKLRVSLVNEERNWKIDKVETG